MSNPKVSAGALRAAREILESIIVFTSEPASSTQLEEATSGAAEIIDRETGVAELLEAAKEYVRYSSGQLWELKRLEQAIAKCEGK